MAVKLSNPSKDVVIAQALLRIGLIFVFLYAIIDSFVHPGAWLGFIPDFAAKFADPKLLLDTFSGVQLILVIWLASGKYLRYAAFAAGLTITAITLSNVSLLPVTFRDVGLALAAFALGFISQNKK